ncbi:putative nuclease HARBI1 [Cucumis melo var. makuwa]|uniref:Nuclease HARBI1 n=1 Tax=Cucumis melo var. makuwa TaxID=1194695 RepID=A0A5A7V8C5_CUCMM|nr:putative nuclease HARBI1 [Cucumis melo var. makuwa]TYK11691.1 putative nuclease HARBI1 [Cucumis melo var. makuwa]
MDRRCFAILCHLLRTTARLVGTEVIDVEEMVVMFLHILVHDMKNRMIQRKFQWSGETVSRHFNLVLLEVLWLHDELLKKPQLVTNSCTDPRWKWFENCLGALDGTYIKVNVSATDHPRYRTRKSKVAINVLGVCNTKGDFVFVLSGWEGSTADSRILRDVISRHNGLKVSKGRWTILRGKSYYPVDVQCRTIMACCLLHNLISREMTNSEIIDDLDEGDSTYATTGEWQVCHEHRNTHGLKRKKQNLLSAWWNWFQLGDGGPIMGHFDLDRPTGSRSETFADVGSNVPNMFNDDVPLGDLHDQDISTMYSQRVHMSPDEMFGIHEVKQVREKIVKVEVRGYNLREYIRSLMEFGNDQLKAIANWPKEKRATEVELCVEVVKQLQDIPELQSQDRAKLMQILFRSVETIEGFLSIPLELKLEYCNILLQNNV